MANTNRVHANIGKDSNAWLDEYSEQTGLSKSSLINMAVEQFIREKKALEAMNDMSNIINQIERLEGLVRQITDQKPE